MTAELTDDDSALVPGFRYPVLTVRVPREMQARKHQLAGVDTALFGQHADPTFLAYEAILATRAAGISVNGSVHMLQVYRQAEPIPLDEPLEMLGEVTEVEEAPKGRIVRSTFRYVLGDGRVPLVAERASIRLRPPGDDARPAPRQGGDASRPGKEDDPAEQVALATKRLVPEQVAEYSEEAENLIHSDPEVARRFGYRAPIAAGLMSSHYYLEALASTGRIRSLELEMRFLRPMFWDDRLDLMGSPAAGQVEHMRLVNSEGKPTGRARVISVAYG